MDEASIKGRFGWMTFDCNKYIPYLLRNQDEKFFCLQIVEANLFKDLLKLLPTEIGSFYQVYHLLF